MSVRRLAEGGRVVVGGSRKHRRHEICKVVRLMISLGQDFQHRLKAARNTYECGISAHEIMLTVST